MYYSLVSLFPCPTAHTRDKTLAVNVTDCVLSQRNNACLHFHSGRRILLTTMATDGPHGRRGCEAVSEGMTGEREVLPFD